MVPLVYIASKVVHGPRWKEIQESSEEYGIKVISSWPRYNPGTTQEYDDLWSRCVSEVREADALLIYHEPGEVFTGAWIEVGVALAHGVPVFAVGCEEYSISCHARVKICASLPDAITKIQDYYRTAVAELLNDRPLREWRGLLDKPRR